MYPVFILFYQTYTKTFRQITMNPPLKVDLHLHSAYSKDSRATPEEVVRRSIELGFDVISITDHGSVQGSLEAQAMPSGLLVIPGQEVKTSDGELIVLGLRHPLPSKQPALETAMNARKQGGFVILPHPFDPMRRGIGSLSKKLLGHIDAVEVFNSRTIFSRFNQKARQFADQEGLPSVVGSDSHFPGEMGKAFMLINSKKSPQEIFNAIRQGRLRLVVNKQGMTPRIKRGLLKIRTYF
jgi:predicted metal-dependent phosphoesterase TrpH